MHKQLIFTKSFLDNFKQPYKKKRNPARSYADCYVVLLCHAQIDCVGEYVPERLLSTLHTCHPFFAFIARRRVTLHLTITTWFVLCPSNRKWETKVGDLLSPINNNDYFQIFTFGRSLRLCIVFDNYNALDTTHLWTIMLITKTIIDDNHAILAEDKFIDF